MVDRTRELEFALGSPDKHVASNETETVVVQRRCLRAARDIKKGETLTRDVIDVLRPAPPEAIMPYEIDRAVDTRANEDIPFGEALRWTMLVEA
jgi:N-acetylneuraminate synthase